MKFSLPNWASQETVALHEEFQAKVAMSEKAGAEESCEAERLRSADMTTIKLPPPEVRLQSKLRAVTAEITSREALTQVRKRLIDIDATQECTRLGEAFLKKRSELAAALFNLGFSDHDPKFKGKAGLDVLFRNTHVRKIATEEGHVRTAVEVLRCDEGQNETKLAELRAQRDKLTADIRELLVV